MPAIPNNKLLDGVRVIDLSQYIPGPFATRQLADLGADVIKIEPPGGDPMRQFMAASDDNVAPVYRHLNRGKRVVRLDLKSEADKAIFSELLADADILLESYRPGTLEKLGFGRPRLQQINPLLIHCALSGYGQTGPYRDRAGHDINYCAASSMLACNGTPKNPVMTYPPLADHAGAMQASTSILAALFARQQNQQGAYLDISLFETVLSWQYLTLLGDKEVRGEGLVSGGAACYNIYPCSDGLFVSLGALEPHFWSRFCESVEQPQWINRQHEKLPQQALIGELRGLFARQPRHYWDTLFESVDCCYQALVLPRELDQQTQVQARELLSDNGPRYPVKINQQPVETEDDFKEFDTGETPHWF